MPLLLRNVFAALFLALVTGTVLFGITVTAADPNTNYLTTPGGPYDGVAEMISPNGSCSGSLIGPRSILTAAHCVTDGSGIMDLPLNTTYVLFDLFGGPQGVGISNVAVAPGWLGTGSGNLSNDLAVLTLSDIAPTSEIYSLFSGAPGSELGQVFTMAGYGFGGTAATGYDTNLLCPGQGNAVRCKRIATNVYDATVSPQIDMLFDGTISPFPWSNLAFDLNDGNNGNSLHGTGTGLVTTALEGTIAPGDSGGPSFINGQIAGVHDFITCVDGYGSCVNFDGGIHDYYGDIGADTEVAQYEGWITSQIVTSTPEPGTWLLGFAGLAAVACRKRASAFATIRFWDPR